MNAKAFSEHEEGFIMGNTRRMQAGWVLVGAAMALSGCVCSTPVDECGTPAVVFLAPADGDTVGLKLDVSVRGVDSSGAAMDLDSAKLEVQQPGEADFGHLTQGDLSGAQATFAQVALGAGDNQLKATVVRKGLSSCTATTTITVTAKDTVPAPKVTQVTFPQDQNVDGVLNGLELPRGTKMLVKVKVKDGSGAKVQVKRGTTVVGSPVDVAAGEATVSLDLLPEEDTANDDFFAELLKGGVAQNTPGSNPEASASIRVNRVAPACTNTTRAVMGPAQDADPLLPAFQLRGTGTVGATVASAVFRISGVGQSAASTPAAGAVSGDVTVTAAGDVTYSVELVATDSDGNTCSDVKQVEVDLVAPVVTISSPVGVDGGNAQVSTTPLAVNVVVSGVNDGTQVCATRKQGSGVAVQVDCSVVTGGLAILDVPFGASGTYTIAVSVTDAAGNSASVSVVVDVALTSCGLSFSRPATCPAYLNSSNLVAGQYQFQFGSGNCTGQGARFSLASVQADGGVGASNQLCNGTQDSAGQFSCIAPLLQGNYLVSAEIDNQTGPASQLNCDVTVNLNTPVITNPTAPSTGSVVINAVQDTLPSTAGAQRVLSFNAVLPLGGRFDVCTTQSVDPVTSQQRTACTDGASGWYLLTQNVSSPANGFTWPEGAYSVKIVVIDAGRAVDTSAPVPVLVDVTPPCVQVASLRLPQDSSGDSNLNAAELDGGMAAVGFKLGCGDTISTLAANDPIALKEIVGGVVSSTRLNAVNGFSQAAGELAIPSTLTPPIERSLRLFVELTDAAGNKNSYSGTTDPATLATRVDSVGPSCSTVQPSASQTILGTADVPGGNMTVSVTTASDVGANGVTVTLAGPSTTSKNVTPSGSSNQASTTFVVSGTAAWTVDATCTDAVGNAASATRRSLTIDLDAPTCQLTSPDAGALYDINAITTAVTVGGAEGRPVAISSTLNGGNVGTLVVDGGVATGLLTYTNGTQDVTATVSDAAGNSCITTAAGVVVNSAFCSLALTSVYSASSGSWINRNNSTTTGATSATATITVNSVDCKAGETVTLSRTAPTAATIGTKTTDASGNASFAAVAVNDGETYSVTITSTAGKLTTKTFSVDLVAPTAGAISVDAVTTTATALFLVAPSDNENVRTSVAGYFADKDGATVGAQLDLAVANVAGAQTGSFNGSVDALFKGVVLATQAVTANPMPSVAFPNLTLPHNDTGALVIRVTDPAGNTTNAYSGAATIDVIAPAPPQNLARVLTDPRKAQVTLDWDPSYDDGTDPATNGHAGYEVRWTSLAVPGNNGMATATDFFGASSKSEGNVPWSSSHITKPLVLPPLNTDYIAVRAHDEVGNYSQYVAPPAVTNMWTEIILSGPIGSAMGTSIAAEASVNGDVIPDIVVGAPNRATNQGSVYVYFGDAGISSQTACSMPACQELQPPDNTGLNFGWDVSTSGNVGDVGTEGKPDLLVSQRGSATVLGRAFLYFGSATGSIDAATFVEFRGAVAADRFGWTTQILKDLDGDNLDEVAISAHGYSTSRGRVYIFKGRSAANWLLLRSATDAVSGAKFVPVTAADWVLEGPTPNLALGGNSFGIERFGLTSIGDLDADGRQEFVVPMSFDSVGRVVLFNSKSVVDAGTPVQIDAGIQVLQGATSTNNALSGFGTRVVGGKNVINGSGIDLVVTRPAASSVYFFGDLTSAGTAGGAPSYSITGTNLFGSHVSIGDVDGDGVPDLVGAEGFTTNNRTWILYQRANAFDSPVDGVTPKFFVSLLTGGALGKSSGIADVNADGKLDVILGDSTNANVRVWR